MCYYAGSALAVRISFCVRRDQPRTALASGSAQQERIPRTRTDAKIVGIRLRAITTREYPTWAMGN